MKTTAIIRRPDFAGGGITAEEKVRLDAHAQLWVGRAMRTAPIDPAKITPAIEALYAAGGLKKPRVIIVPSPAVMAFAYSFASAVLYQRKNGGFSGDATRAATDAATYAATYAATRAATDDAKPNWVYELALDISGNHNDAMFMVQCSGRWWNSYQGGNMWAAYDCYLSGARDILGLELPAHAGYAAWEQCAIHGGFRVLHEDFCMVSDFPSVLKVDDQNRPHCIDGPSHQWRDGWSLYHVHGVRLEESQKHIVLTPEMITVDEIEHEQNAEVRRVMMEQYGYERYIGDCNAQVVDTRPDDFHIVGLRSARLLVKQVPEDEPVVFVDLLNSTPEPDGSVRRYLMRVDPNAYNGEASRNCQAAAASTWRDDIDGKLTFKDWREYAPVFES